MYTTTLSVTADILIETYAIISLVRFGAECLAAGSSILNRETESAVMRPLAKSLTKSLETVRALLREQCLRNSMDFSDRLKENLVLFDRLFAEFELSYVSAMVPVKTALEYNHQQDIIVLFSETLQRALSLGLLSQDLIDTCDPALMFTIPRLAIVCGLLILPDGPLNLQRPPSQLSELFRPFRNLLCKIRDLLWTLTGHELQLLEKALCSTDAVAPSAANSTATSNASYPVCKTDEYVSQFHNGYPAAQKYDLQLVLVSLLTDQTDRRVLNLYCHLCRVLGKLMQPNESSHSNEQQQQQQQRINSNNANADDADIAETNSSYSSSGSGSGSGSASTCSSDSSSVTSAASECQDDEEIALALQASLLYLYLSLSISIYLF